MSHKVVDETMGDASMSDMREMGVALDAHESALHAAAAVGAGRFEIRSELLMGTMHTYLSRGIAGLVPRWDT